MGDVLSADRIAAQAGRIVDDEAGPLDAGDPVQAGEQVVRAGHRHRAMLAERRDEGEREEWRDWEANRSGEQVPVSCGDRVREAAPSQPAHPGQDR